MALYRFMPSMPRAVVSASKRVSRRKDIYRGMISSLACALWSHLLSTGTTAPFFLPSNCRLVQQAAFQKQLKGHNELKCRFPDGPARQSNSQRGLKSCVHPPPLLPPPIFGLLYDQILRISGCGAYLGHKISRR